MIPTHLKVGATLPKLRNYLSSRHREPSPPPSARSNLTNDNLPAIPKLRSTLVDHPKTYLLLHLDFHLLIWWSELMCWIYDDQRTNQHSKFPQHRPFSEIPQHQLSNSLNTKSEALFPGADNPGTSIHLHKGDRLNAKMVHALYISRLRNGTLGRGAKPVGKIAPSTSSTAPPGLSWEPTSVAG